MTVAERLRARAEDFELKARFHAERAPVDREHLVASNTCLLVSIVLRVVAEELAEEREAA